MSLDDDELSALIRREGTRHAAPDSLRAGIRTQIALEDARRAPAAAPKRARFGWLSFGWGTTSASFALGMLCMGLLLPLAQRFPLGEPVEAALVGRHVRALQAGPLIEVVSSDRHTVKPWFQGRIDFAPPVPDLAADGFPLMGGRIEHVRGRVVATLAYARNRHVIDVFIWPGTDPVAPVRTTQRGFNVVHWADGSMQYWAVGDLDREEMDTFTRHWQERVSGR